MKNPPTKRHELLALALADYAVIKNDPRYQIDMGSWHSYSQETDICYVCLAGCLIANTIKYPWNKTVMWSELPWDWDTACSTINMLRCGISSDTFVHMFPVQPRSDIDDTAWLNDMQHMLEYLQLQDL